MIYQQLRGFIGHTAKKGECTKMHYNQSVLYNFNNNSLVIIFFCICVCIPTNSHVLGIKKLRSQVSPHQLTNSSHLAEKFELIHPLTFRREVLETRLCFHVLGSLEFFGTAFEVFGLSPDMIRFSIKNPGTCRIKILHPWLKKRLADICLLRV